MYVQQKWLSFLVRAERREYVVTIKPGTDLVFRRIAVYQVPGTSSVELLIDILVLLVVQSIDIYSAVHV